MAWSRRRRSCRPTATGCFLTDSVDEAIDRILAAATGEFGLVWEATPKDSPRWYLGEQELPKGAPAAKANPT